MASTWPAKNNYATGDVLTAANMNGVGDDLNDLYNGSRIPNPILNSNFSVWQRGTSIALAASTSAANGYTADRWDVLNGANQAMTISRQATSDTTNLPNIQYCARVQRNSGQTGTGTYYIRQGFETINSIPFIGKTVTFSFYARAGANYSATGNALQATVGTGTGTDQNPMSYTGEAVPLNSAVTLTTTWQRFTLTGILSASATEIYVGFSTTPVGTAGANDYFEVTGVQIDVGSVAQPYRPNQPTYQGELAACQRYFQRLVNGADATNEAIIMGMAYGATGAIAALQWLVPMRTTPTMTISNAGHFAIFNASASDLTATAFTLTSSGTTSRHGRLDITVAIGLVGGNAGYVRSINASSTMDISAEL